MHDRGANAASHTAIMHRPFFQDNISFRVLLLSLPFILIVAMFLNLVFRFLNANHAHVIFIISLMHISTDFCIGLVEMMYTVEMVR